MTVYGVSLEDRRELIMIDNMLINGNLFADNIIIIGGGEIICVEEPESANYGLAVNGDLTIDGTFLVKTKVFVTGDVITKEV